MANNFDKIIELANVNNMGLSNTIKRDFGIPLDFTSVQESYDAAVIYAATNTLAYVGQTIAVGAKLYIISDVANGTHTVGEGEAAVSYDNYLTEVGSKTAGDNNTIVLDGQTLKLAGLTGLANNKTYVPSLVNGRLTWNEPDTETAEGQQAAISALETRATDLETTVNGRDAVGNEGEEGYVPAVVGLVDKVDTITTAVGNASSPESAEGAGDGVAATGLYKAIEDAEARAKAYADANDSVYDDSGVQADISANTSAINTLAGNVYTKNEIDTKVGTINNAIGAIEESIAGITHFTAKVVGSTQDVTETGVLYLIKDEEVEGNDKYQEYLYLADQGAVLIGDTAIDLTDYVTTNELEAELAKELVGYVQTSTLADYAKIDDVVANSAFETFKTSNTEAINAARTGAVADVQALGYATTAEVAADLATKIERASIAHTSDGVTEGVTADGVALNIVVDAFTKAETLQKITDRITEINGGQTAGEVLGSLNSYIETNNAEIAAIKAVVGNAKTDAAAASGLFDLIDKAQAKADKGVADAKDAMDAVTALSTTHTTDIGAITSRLTTLETTKGDHSARIATAEGKISSLEAAESTISAQLGVISGNITSLVSEDSRLAGLIANKADASNVYTIEAADSAIASAIAAIPATDLSNYYNKNEIDSELVLKADASGVYTKDDADGLFMTEDEVEAKINALIKAADPDNSTVIKNIENLVAYVDANAGEITGLLSTVTAHTKLIEDNTADIAEINQSLAAIVSPVTSDEISVAADGKLSITQLSVSKLAQSDDEVLVLNGGNAKVKAVAEPEQ